MRSALAALLVLLAPLTLLPAEDLAAAFAQWQQTYDEADRRVPSEGTMRDALNQAASSRGRMRALDQACRDRAGRIDSLAFKAKFLKGEWESAQREAERKSAARDARFAELMGPAQSWLQEQNLRLRAEADRMKQWEARVDARKAEIDAWAARIAPLMRTYTIPDEQAGYDHALAEKNRYVAAEEQLLADIKEYNAALLAAQEDETRTAGEGQSRLAQIEAFVAEEGRASIEAQAIASKKERDYIEAQSALDTAQQEQDDDQGQLASLLADADALVRTVVEALDTPPPSAAAFSTEPYATHDSDEAASAVAIGPPASPTSSGRPSAPSRFLLLPSATPASQDHGSATAAADQLKERLAVEARAAVLAAQYSVVPTPPATTVAMTDSTTLVRAPAGSLGPAPIGYGGPFDDGSAVLVISDDMLYQVFDPRVLISEADYTRAQMVQARYQGLVPKLEAAIAKLRQERERSAGYSAEFETMRAEIARGSVRDILSIYGTTAGPLLESLAHDPRYAATLTPETLNRITLAISTMQMEVGREHADLNQDRAEQRKQRLEVLDSGAEALLAVCTGELAKDAGSRVMLEQMGKMLKVYTKVSRYALDPQLGTRRTWEEVGEITKTAVEVAAVYVPPVALGVGIESLGERGLSWAITQEAVDSLAVSLRTTDDAIVYLSDRLENARRLSEQAATTINDYRAADPVRRRTMRVEVPGTPVAESPSNVKPGDDGGFDGRRQD